MAEGVGFEPTWVTPNGFQDRLVMTASITLHRVSLAKVSGIWREFRERTVQLSKNKNR